MKKVFLQASSTPTHALPTHVKVNKTRDIYDVTCFDFCYGGYRNSSVLITMRQIARTLRPSIVCPERMGHNERYTVSLALSD
jgi:hypothetical protein